MYEYHLHTIPKPEILKEFVLDFVNTMAEGDWQLISTANNAIGDLLLFFKRFKNISNERI